VVAALAILFLAHAPVGAQTQAAPPKGWEFFALPAVNFDSDEGFGYGAFVEMYNYGNGVTPYRFTMRPMVFLTTKGRRDVVLFFDAPKVLPNNWRLDGFIGREQQLATPYYGVGNTAAYDSTLEREPNVYYYRYARTTVRIMANLQHQVGKLPARGLIGAGFNDVRTDAIPFDSGTTLFANNFGVATPPKGRLVYLRAGLVWDTRDREVAPHSGTYGDFLVQRVDKTLGATNSYTRFTGILRKYWPLNGRLVFAQRLLAQDISGNVPIFDLPIVQTSFQQQEGLGGSNSVRGLAKNRFVGKGLALLNSEVRWRFKDFRLRGKEAQLTQSFFVDAGRVWSDALLGKDSGGLHAGYGTGTRLGLGPSFTVALDLARSSENRGTQIYIGLGYPF
jgi:outer membrane protein assembly factor BamA